MRPPLPEAELQALVDPDLHLDSLVARVWATPAGAALAAELRRLNRRALTLEEIDTRVLRMRGRWGDRSHDT